MKRHLFPLLVVVSLSASAILALLYFMEMNSSRLALASPIHQSTAPIVMSVKPSSAPNNLDTLITITGTDFVSVTTPAVQLGNTFLMDAGWISNTLLTATVPWGLDLGTYTLTVINPDGQSGILPNAFTVTQGIGVWTTDGPYGGRIFDMAVSPVTSQTAFALVGDVGLFRTQDSGDHWSLAIYDAYPSGVMYGIAPTYTLYYWGLTGLWGSIDEGQTFQLVDDSGLIDAFAPDPLDAQSLWIGWENSIRHTTDGGATWQDRSNGLPPGIRPATLSIDPTNPSILYVVLSDGQVFKTTDSGANWYPASNGLPMTLPATPYVLAINPFTPTVLLYTHFIGPGPGYRSTDGGVTWSPITNSNFISVLTDFAFSPHIEMSGTVYASLDGSSFIATSTDGGETWVPGELRGKRRGTLSVGLDPTSGLPVYLGGGDPGVWRSHDGGQTWELATNGITGLQVLDLAVNPGQPESVYAAIGGAGGFKSNNAGGSWQRMDLPDWYVCSVAVDPLQPDRIYMIPSFSLYRSLNSGDDWIGMVISSTLGPEFETFEDLAVAPDSTAIYAGGYDSVAWSNNQSIGVLWRSQDMGENWTKLMANQPISIVSTIAISPVDSQTVYLATGNRTDLTLSSPGLGVFRSHDSGETWQHITEGLGHVPVWSIAISPYQPQTIYATAWITSENKVAIFKSMDGGDTWTATTFRNDESQTYPRTLLVDPLSPDIVYAGFKNGLFRTKDGGTTWERAAGSLGTVPILSIAGATDGKRTIIYIGTIGGLTSGTQMSNSNMPLQIPDDFVQGGIYQQTLVQHTFYLPLMQRSPED